MVQSNPANTNCVAAGLYPSPATREGSIRAWEDTGILCLAQNFMKDDKLYITPVIV
jgi:hypothetical protein